MKYIVQRQLARSGEAGDTLVEVLVTILVLSVAGLALLAGFSTTIAGSAQHRSLAANDLVLRAAAESAFSMIQQQTSPLYAVCHTSPYSDLASQYNQESQAVITNFGAPTSLYTASISVPPGSSIPAPVQFWSATANSGAGGWVTTEPSDCTKPVPELITMTVLNLSNRTSESTQFVVNDLNSALNASANVSVISLTPNQIAEGATSIMTLTGSGFYSDAKVTFSNPHIVVNAVASCPSTNACSSLTMSVTIPNVTSGSSNYVSPGTYDITVTNPSEGTSGTGDALLQVTNSATPVGVVPNVLAVDGSESFTLYGLQFETGMSVAVTPVSGPNLAVTNLVVTSSTTATMTITGPGTVSGEGGYAFIVTLPGAASSTASSGPLLTVYPDPTISSSTPVCNPGFKGTGNCVITGANFQPGATVSIGLDSSNNPVGQVNSVQVVPSTVTNQLPTEIDINVSGVGSVSGATGNIVVINPDGTQATFIGGFQNGP